MASHASEDFSSKYTNANLAPDSTAYNSTILCGLVRQLEDVDGGSISAAAPGIIVRQKTPATDENKGVLILSGGCDALRPTPR